MIGIAPTVAMEMELTGVEPVSALGSDLPLIHRLSFFYPRSGDRRLSPTVGCSSKGLNRR